MACLGQLWKPLLWSALLRLRRRGAGLRQVRQGGLRFVFASYGKAITETTYTVGVVAASMPQGGMDFGGVCHVAPGFALVSYGSV